MERPSVGIMEQPGFKKELNEEMLQLYLVSDLCGRREYFLQGCEKADAGTLSDLEKRKTIAIDPVLEAGISSG